MNTLHTSRKLPIEVEQRDRPDRGKGKKDRQKTEQREIPSYPPAPNLADRLALMETAQKDLGDHKGPIQDSCRNKAPRSRAAG